jgi:ABC-2 type transport system permease protein
MARPANPFRLLASNEWRLYFRSGLLSKSSLTFLIIGQVLLHLIALSMAVASRLPRPPGMPNPSGVENLSVLLSMGLISMFLLMVSRALGGAVQSLYTRGDLDLLLCSPVDQRAILGVRMGSLAVAVAMEVALLVWPFANVFVLFGRVAWFKAYLLVPAMAMFATSIGLAVTLLSFRTIGPRRTRTVVQVLAVLVGISVMLGIYLPSMMQQGRSRGPLADSVNMLAHSNGDFRTLLLAPAQWLTSGALPTLLFFIGAAALLAVTIHYAGAPIVRTLTAISGGPARQSTRTASGPERFRSNFRWVVVLKEFKLIMRDPFVMVQVLQQSLMMIPVVFVLWRARTGFDLPLVWLSVIWLAAGLAGPLSWLTITAEDAPDLLAAAPVSRAALIRAKIEAAMLPTLPIIALPLVFVLPTRPWYAVCLTLSAFCSALTHALLNMRNPVAKRRDSFKVRYRGNGASGLIELLALLFWVGVCLLFTWLGSQLGWH